MTHQQLVEFIKNQKHLAEMARINKKIKEYLKEQKNENV